MAVVTLFKIRGAHRAVIGPSGTRYNFQGSPVGKCWTTNKKEIEELTALAEAGEAGIYIDAKDATVDTEAATPMEALKKQIIKEYLAQQAQLKPASEYNSDAANFARGVAGTDENVLTGTGMAAQKAQAALIGEASAAPAPATSAMEKIAAATAKNK